MKTVIPLYRAITHVNGDPVAKVRQLITSGCVQVDGEVVTDPNKRLEEQANVQYNDGENTLDFVVSRQLVRNYGD